MQNNMKRIIFILLLCVVATGVVSSIVYSAPPANVGYVGTLLPVNGDDKNDIGTSTNEFRNLYLSRSLVSSSKTSTSSILGNLMIGDSMFNGQLDITSLGSGVAQLQVSTSTNDFAKVTFGNMSAGTASMFCNIYNNGRSARAGVASSYYGGICFAGHNYNTAGFDGIKPNGIALFASDGDVSIGSASMTAASSSIRFFVGGNSAAFSGSGQDAILQGGTGNLGIRVTNPGSTLSISERHGSGTPMLGSELTDATGWTSTDWTGDYNVGFTHTAGNTTNLSRTMTVSNASYYQITFTITGRTAGSVTVALGYATTTQTYSTNATYGVGHKPVTTNGPLVITPTTDFNGTISAISVKIISAVSNPIFVLHDSAGTAGVEFRQGTSSLQNTFMGNTAGAYNTTGVQNTAVGYRSLYSNTTGSYNTAQGVGSLYSNTTGSNNSAQGYYSLFSNTTGSYNSAQGVYSLYSNTTGSANTAQGYQALRLNTTGSSNAAQGVYSLYLNTTGTSNSAQGVSSLYSNITGSNNTAQGVNSLSFNTSATNTTAIGYNAGRGTANYNAQGGVYLGYQAGYSAGTGGNFNTLLGYQAGYNITTGSDNIIIGQNVNATSSTATRSLNIGNVLYGVGMYDGSSVSVTPTADGRIGIGTSSPTTDLQVNEATATSTISATVVNGSTRSTTMGGKLILQDMAGGTCTEITTQSGVMSARAVACP